MRRGKSRKSLQQDLIPSATIVPRKKPTEGSKKKLRVKDEHKEGREREKKQKREREKKRGERKTEKRGREEVWKKLVGLLLLLSDSSH